MMASAPTEKKSAYANGELIRRLLALSWRYRRQTVIVLALQITLLFLGLCGLGLTGLAFDVLAREVTDKAPEPLWPFGLRPPSAWSPMMIVSVIALLVLAMALARAALNYFYSMAVAKLVHRDIVAHLRAEVYDKLQRLGFDFFDRNASGTIINRVTGDVQMVRMFIDGVLIQSVIMALSLGVYLCYMLNLHVGLTVVCLSTMPLLYLATTIYSRWIHPAYARNREIYDRMVLTLSESMQGIHVTKGFAREQLEAEKFAGVNKELRDQQQNIFWRVSLYSPVIEILTQGSLLILLAYGGYLVIQQQLTLGAGLVVFTGLMQQFSGQIANIAAIANNVQQSLIGAQRVFEILDAPIDIQSPRQPVLLPAVRGAVQFEHVSFGYDNAEIILHEISFSAAPGQCIAILGATGAGKSSLMNLIPRFYDVTGGRVLVDGVDVREFDLAQLRRNIGLVFQESFLFSNTIAANIAFGHPEATRAQIERAARIAAADRFISELPAGYDTVLGEGGLNLSGGQRQRLAIARAILLEPAILLLDDPTASIDPQTEHEILAAVEQATQGRTTFIVAHRLSTLRRADQILVLDDGRIVQRGTHAELMAQKGHYLKIAQLQLEAAEDQEFFARAEFDHGI
jgi:ABC-type multidrug transport system fused ATPase/permease subunit